MNTKCVNAKNIEISELRKRRMRDTKELTKLMQEIQGLKVEIEKKSQSLQVNARELITSKREIERLNKMIKINDILHQKRLQDAKSNSTTHLSPCNKFLTVNSNIESCSKTPKSANSKSGNASPLQSGIRKSQLNLKN